MVLSMIYDDFVKKVNDLNGKDCYTRSDEKNNPYNDFYNHYNPMGAEFDFNYGTVFMIPFNMISKVTLEYKIIVKNDFLMGLFWAKRGYLGVLFGEISVISTGSLHKKAD